MSDEGYFDEQMHYRILEREKQRRLVPNTGWHRQVSRGAVVDQKVRQLEFAPAVAGAGRQGACLPQAL
ncbi:MAG TPA: hypothetical protein VMU60_11165 [Syntrophobacteria bacterium]|nr:hypothetical protein [Syntrophobacteria bacterium]